MNNDALRLALNGREYLSEISPEIQEMLDGTDTVIVFGASDDIMCFRGAIKDDVDCYGGGTAYLAGKELLSNECDDEYCPYFEKLKKLAKTIEAKWCAEPDICFTYETSIPHQTFEIMEDGEKYCRGIIFNLAAV